jgi:hypothetical protein
LRQPPRQLSLIFVEKQIGDVNQPASLALDDGLNRGMCVTERIHSNSAQEIQIAFAVRIPQMHAPPAHEKNGLALIRRQQELGFQAGDGSEAHALKTSVPYSILVK